MKKILRYSLDMQMFAEPDGGEGGTPNNQPAGMQEIDYEKLAETLEKRAATSEESALKGILKGMGLSKEEMDTAVNDYKTKKADKAREEQERINSIIKENNAYKQKELMNSIKTEAKKIAVDELEVREDRFEKLLALCDQKKFVDDKGVISKESIKQELETQLKEIPEFKATRKRVVISSGTGNQNPPDLSDDAEYRKRKYGKSKYYKG